MDHRWISKEFNVPMQDIDGFEIVFDDSFDPCGCGWCQTVYFLLRKDGQLYEMHASGDWDRDLHPFRGVWDPQEISIDDLRALSRLPPANNAKADGLLEMRQIAIEELDGPDHSSIADKNR